MNKKAKRKTERVDQGLLVHHGVLHPLPMNTPPRTGHDVDQEEEYPRYLYLMRLEHRIRELSGVLAALGIPHYPLTRKWDGLLGVIK
jgi:hypothetical protein